MARGWSYRTYGTHRSYRTRAPAKIPGKIATGHSLAVLTWRDRTTRSPRGEWPREPQVPPQKGECIMKAVLTALALFGFTGLASANINVSGTGKVVYVPDIGWVSVGVTSEGKNAAEAWERNRQKVARIFEALKQLGIDPKDLQTSGLNVSPKYVHRPNQEPQFVGYTASYDLRITVRKLPELGKILDSAVEAGANQRMNISFGCSDHDKLLDDARAKAVADARKKATS